MAISAVCEFWIVVHYRVTLSPLKSGMAGAERLITGNIVTKCKIMGNIVILWQILG
jgi:hypothetical protein